MALIKIRGITIDPSSPDGQKLLSKIPQSEYILVQPREHTSRAVLEENKIEIIQRIDRITYLCRYQPRNFNEIKLDCVSSVVPYHPVWKVSPVEIRMCEKDSSAKHIFTVVLHAESGSSLTDVQAAINGLNGPEILSASGSYIDVKLELRFIYEIAKIESVRSIEIKLTPSLC